MLCLLDIFRGGLDYSSNECADGVMHGMIGTVYMQIYEKDDGTARPAFSIDAAYDLSKGNSIRFKVAVLDISSYDNQMIQYKVVSGFAAMAQEDEDDNVNKEIKKTKKFGKMTDCTTPVYSRLTVKRYSASDIQALIGKLYAKYGKPTNIERDGCYQWVFPRADTDVLFTVEKKDAEGYCVIGVRYMHRAPWAKCNHRNTQSKASRNAIYHRVR